MAAEHLLERGFTNFAYLGGDRFNWSKLRRARFMRVLAEAGHPCATYRGTTTATTGTAGRWDLSTDELARWLQSLPKPVGVMAAWDGFGQQLLEVCRQNNVAVPDEIAVQGRQRRRDLRVV